MKVLLYTNKGYRYYGELQDINEFHYVIHDERKGKIVHVPKGGTTMTEMEEGEEHDRD